MACYANNFALSLPDPVPITAVAATTVTRGPMQLLELSPGELGVRTTGIYVVDEDQQVLAGPFAEVSDAIFWIDQNAAFAVDRHPSDLRV